MMIDVKCHAGLCVGIAWSSFGITVFNHISHKFHVYFLVFFFTWRHKPFLEVVHSPDSIISVVKEAFEAFF